jgi:hypothetical protein
MAKRKTGQPDEGEIKNALEGAGYPFEMRVYEQLRAGGMDPIFGCRARTDPDDATTIEIDIIGRAHVAYAREGVAPSVQILALIQAKKIHDGCIVGFLEKERTSGNTAGRVPTVGGLPSYRVLEAPNYNAHADMIVGPGGLHAGLEPLTNVPHCVQWTVAKRVDKPNEIRGEVRADHEKGTFEDLAGLVRASECLAREHSLFRLRGSKLAGPRPDMHVHMPTIVVDAPLYTYDVHSKTLEQTDWFSVTIAIDTFRGTQRRLIDVVSHAGVPSLIDAYQRVGARLKQTLESGLDQKLALYAAAQQSEFQEAEVRAALYEKVPPRS